MLQMITKLKISYFMGGFKQAKNDHFPFIQNLRRIELEKLKTENSSGISFERQEQK